MKHFWAHATTSINGEQKSCTKVATMAQRGLLGTLERLPHRHLYTCKLPTNG